MDTLTYHIIFIIYAILLIIYGLFPKKSSLGGNSKDFNSDAEEFLISNRSLTGFDSGLTISATKIGGGLIITYSTLFFTYGLSALSMFVGYILGYYVFYRFARRLYDESSKFKYYTISDYFQRHHGIKVGLLISTISVLTMTGWILTNLIAGAKLLEQLTNISYVVNIIGLCFVMLSYLVIGGYRAVVRTDIIQYGSLVAISVVIGLIFFESSISTTEIVVSDLSLKQIILFFILGLLFPMGSADLWQRIYSVKDSNSVIKAINIASVSFITVGLILSFLCYKLMQLDLQIIASDPELGLVLGVAEVLSTIKPALIPFWYIAIISAILSSADTFIFTAASLIVQDMYKRFNDFDAVSKPLQIYYIRVAIVSLSILAIIFSYLFKSVASVTLFFFSLTVIISVLAYFSWYLKIKYSLPYLIAGISGTLSVIIHTSYIKEATTFTAAVAFFVTFVIMLSCIGYTKLCKQKK